MNTLSLFTIGYEDRSISEFIERLNQFSITALVDVREIPLSRKKGFSKKQLKEYLEKNDIQYIHIKQLGSPKKLRDKLREDKDYESFFEAYTKYLSTQIEILQELYTERVLEETICLMCYERLPSHCHRKVIAEEIKRIDGNGLIIKHI